tara:strand:- start:2603 stop:3025 length:423 start_codon:yes stop_codon:yes gene_type:complete
LSNKFSQKHIDQKDWEDFLKSSEKISDKEKLEDSKIPNYRYRFDFHGYKIDQANIKVGQIISKCYEEGISEILIITGKGKHSDETDNVYVSKEFSTLKTSIPDFIKNNSELNSKIKNIKYAPQNEGGEGALIIKLKKITK